jgi:D-alanyl-D-alanine carboxypeptidase (penicillin-binding protein 5/6)
MRSALLRFVVSASTLLGILASVAPAAAAPDPTPGITPCRGAVLPAGAAPLPAALTPAAWLVADLDSGAVVAECRPHERHAPASTLKLLTVLTVLPSVDLRQTVTVLPQDLDFEPGSSAVGLVAGGTYRVETLVLGLLLVSGNDAANVLARIAGGTGGVPATLTAMNARAAELGALDTHAVTPHGLDATGQVTSAHDLAVIARACFARADFRRLAATRTAQIPPQAVRLPGGERKAYPGYQIQNDNRLLDTYPGALGGKTGFTDLARHTFVGAAERDGRRLVVTFLRGEQAPTRIREQAAALLDWAFAVPAGTPPVDRLTPPPPSPDVAGAHVERTPAAAPVSAAETGTGVGTVLLWLFGGLAATVTALRIRVRRRLARRARERQLRAPRPMARRRRPGSGRPAPAPRHPSRGPRRPRGRTSP